ncbi:MAG: NAD-dependent epimerase/dehydratase family protein [Anaerolineales bacterium]|nr:NAD-dependent epimerase/dehydratase family protein [Anaerolineales bacterium]
MNFQSLRCLVTGGAGFIGSTLVKRLVGSGAQVSVVDNLWRGNLENLKSANGDWAIDLEKDFHLVDLTDYAKCAELVREVDVVYHLADIVAGINFVFGNEPFIFRQNLLINTNVLSAAVLNQIPNYIYVGTACSFPKSLQMQPGIVRLNEEQTYPAEPESSYGWSKLMGEYEAELAQKDGKINVGLLRLHNVYGPGAAFDPKRSQVLPSLIRKAIRYPEEPFIVWGSGNQYRDFIYVDDVIEGLLAVFERGMNRGLIQIGSERPTTIREAAELIVKISGKNIDVQWDTSKPEGDRGRIADCTRARACLGWKPRVDLETGLQRTYDWVAARHALAV